MRTTRRRMPAGTIAPDMPIMMVQSSASIFFHTSKATPRFLPWNAVPCMRSRICAALEAPTGSNGRVGTDKICFLLRVCFMFLEYDAGGPRDGRPRMHGALLQAGPLLLVPHQTVEDGEH